MGLYLCLMLGTAFFGLLSTPPASEHKDKNNQHQATLLASCILLVCWVLLAFKAPTIGSDTPAYLSLFERTQTWITKNAHTFWQQILVNNDSRYEIGYVVFNRLLARFTSDPQWLFILTGVFFIITIKKFIFQNSKDIYFSIFLFISLRYFYFTMSGLRQSIALCLCLIAYRYLKRRKPIFFALFVLFAMLFHMSAVLFLIAYPLSYLKWNAKNVSVILFAGAVVVIGFHPILNVALSILPKYYSHYTTTERFASGNVGNILVALIQLAFLLVAGFSDYGHEESASGEARFNEASTLKYFMLLAFLLSVLSIRATTLDRLYHYFWIFSIIYIPNVTSKIRGSYAAVYVTNCAIMIFTGIYNLALLYYRPEWNMITPYRFFWN